MSMNFEGHDIPLSPCSFSFLPLAFFFLHPPTSIHRAPVEGDHFHVVDPDISLSTSSYPARSASAT